MVPDGVVSLSELFTPQPESMSNSIVMSKISRISFIPIPPIRFLPNGLCQKFKISLLI